MTMRVLVFVVSAVLFATPSLCQDEFFVSIGVKIHYIQRGTGEPVILIHGLSGSTATWSEFGVIDKLAAHHRVIALDCRGHGLSDKPHDPRQYGSEMGMDVVRLLDHLKIQKAHIVGYSMGGSIIAKLLTTHPERFITATVGGAAGMFQWTDSDERVSEKEASERETEGISRSLTMRLDPNAPVPSEEEFRRRAEAFKQNPNNDAHALAAVARGRRGNVTDPRQAATVTVPTLAIVGSADPNVEQFQKWKAVRPNIRLIVLEGATHSGEKGVRSRPEFIESVQKFIGQHSAAH